MTTNTDTQAHGGGVEAVREAVARIIDPHSFVPYQPTGAPDDVVFADMVKSSLDDAYRKADRIIAALASPAATSAETQGGDGVREAIRKLIEGGKLSCWLDEDEHVETFEQIRAALAPSTSAATRGEPGGCYQCGGDGLVVTGWDDDAYENTEGPCPACSHPLPAERAQAKEGRSDG